MGEPGNRGGYLLHRRLNQRRPGHKDMAMIAIPADTPGISFGPLYETLSYTYLPMSEMYLDKVVVSEDNIILPIGQGLQVSLMATDIARVSIASGCCGLMQAALDAALSYSKNQKMFDGKNIRRVTLISAPALARAIYQMTGRTTAQFSRQVRLARAQELLTRYGRVLRNAKPCLKGT